MYFIRFHCLSFRKIQLFLNQNFHLSMGQGAVKIKLVA